MYLARVIGNVVAPVQHAFYRDKRILLVRRTDPGANLTGPDRVAVALVDAGLEDLVLVMEEGSSARDLLGDKSAPVRSVIVGVVDEVEVEGQRVAGNE